MYLRHCETFSYVSGVNVCPSPPRDLVLISADSTGHEREDIHNVNFLINFLKEAFDYGGSAITYSLPNKQSGTKPIKSYDYRGTATMPESI